MGHLQYILPKMQWLLCSDFLQLYNKQKNVLTKRKKNNFLIHTIHIKSIQTLQLKDAISVTNIGI